MQFRLHTETGIPCQIISGKHHAFAESRRTRSVIDKTYLIVAQLGIFYIITGKTVGISFFEMLVDISKILHNIFPISLVEAAIIVEGNNTPHLIEFLHLDMLPRQTAGKKQHGIGMVYDVVHIIGIEILQNRNNNRPISNRSEKRHHPTRSIPPDKSDFVAPTYLAMLQQEMYTCYLSSHIAISKRLAGIVIGQCRQVPILLETFLVDFDKIFLYHETTNIFSAKVK